MTTTDLKPQGISDVPARTENDAIDRTNLIRLLSSNQVETHPTATGSVRAFTWRALLKIKHVPSQLFDVTVWPIMMLLMFTYLFGGAIAGTTGDYLQFLLPGMLVMTIVMITMYTGISVNIDKNKGVSDRFKTLPMWRPSPMLGFLFADIIRYIAASVVMLATGFLMGFRPDGGFSGMALGVGMMLLFSFCMSWIWTWLGLIVSNEKTVMMVSQGLLFPLTFLSNIMVDPSSMPSWLQPIVSNTPISQLVDSVRGFFSGNPDMTATITTFVWSGILLVVFGFLTVRAYNRN